jgi:hypothetical protein
MRVRTGTQYKRGTATREVALAAEPPGEMPVRVGGGKHERGAAVLIRESGLTTQVSLAC